MGRFRVVLALALALGLSALAGTARGDTFGIVPGVAPMLPSAAVPNLPGSIALPASFTTPPPLAEVRSFDQLQTLWQQAGQAYGIPWQVLGAINKVESNFGRNMGPSSAGAVGWMQFMPSTWERWGLDANGDGIADPWNPEDAVYSSARYLAAAGGATDIRRAIFAYNHADWYVNEVLGVAGLFGTGALTAAGPSPSNVATLDQLQEALDASQHEVTAANTRLVAAEKAQRKLERLSDRWRTRANASTLLSNQLAAQKQATLVGIEADRAGATVADLRAQLGLAEQNLASARESARTASFAPVASTLLAAPAYSAGYVFPVGGGAGNVSVSHTHHDYPAADIAAPAGSPVYALSAAVVQESWHYPSGKCGIGVTMQTSEGLVWTYCHLAYLEPTVVPGSTLSAGSPVGLVGSTGHSSGPHLHLQLHPATAYPQAMSWFASFAGTAFRWQDEAPTRALAAVQGALPSRDLHPVFAVLPSAAPAAAGQVIRFTR